MSQAVPRIFHTNEITAVAVDHRRSLPVASETSVIAGLSAKSIQMTVCVVTPQTSVFALGIYQSFNGFLSLVGENHGDPDSRPQCVVERCSAGTC
jgi:hypothetical protein